MPAPTYSLPEAQRQLLQNVAAIAADFHTHRLYNEFYDTFGKLIDGFVGNYGVCIGMAEALTDWELENGGMLNPQTVLREIQVLEVAGERA